MASSPQDSKTTEINAIGWTGVVLAAVFTASRLFTRLRLTKNAGFDDAIIVFSLLLLVACNIIITESTYAGIGTHQAYLQPQQISRAVELELISEPFGILALCLPKIAVVALLIKLRGLSKLGSPRTLQKWLLYGLTITNTVLNSVCFILPYAQCDPPSASWNPDPNAKCWSPNVLSYFSIGSAAFSAFADFVLALFPISILWDLQMLARKKVAIAFIMGLGVFAGICAAIKASTLTAFVNKSDFTWAASDLIIWTLVEASAIIICACISTLRPLYLYCLNRWDSSPSGNINHRMHRYTRTTGQRDSTSTNAVPLRHLESRSVSPIPRALLRDSSRDVQCIAKS